MSSSSEYSDFEMNFPIIRNAEREIENQIDRLKNAPIDEPPIQLNIEEICTNIEQDILNCENEPRFSKVQNKAVRLEVGSDLTKKTSKLHQQLSDAHYTYAVNEVIQYERITEIAEKIVIWSEAEGKKEKSILRLARKNILQTVFEDDEAEREDDRAVEVQAQQRADGEQEVPQLYDARIPADVPMEDQFEIAADRGILERQDSEMTRAPAFQRSQDLLLVSAPPIQQSFEQPATAEHEQSIIPRVDLTTDNLLPRVSDSGLMRYLRIEDQDVHEPERRSDIPPPLSESRERTREEDLERFRRILEGNGDQLPMDIPEITDQELRAQGIADMEQTVTAPAEVERMEALETEVERVGQPAEGVPARRRLFTPEPQDIVERVEEVVQPLEEIVERAEFRRQVSDGVPVLPTVPRRPEAPREVQDQIVPLEAEEDEEILEMPPIEEVLTPRRRRRRLPILDEQIVIEDYAKRATKLNNNVVVERIRVYEGPPRILKESGAEFLMTNPGYGVSTLRERRLGDRLRNLYTRMIKNPPQRIQVVPQRQSPVQEPVPQQVQVPEVPEPEIADLPRVAKPLKRKRTIEPDIVSPTDEIAERLRELEGQEVVQVQEKAREVAEVPRTPEVGGVGQLELPPPLEVLEPEDVRLPQAMEEQAEPAGVQLPQEMQDPAELEGVHLPQEIQERAEPVREQDQQAPEGAHLPQEMPQDPDAILPADRAPERPLDRHSLRAFSPVQRVLRDDVEVDEAPWAPGVIRVDVEVHAEGVREQVQDEQAQEPERVEVAREGGPRQEEIIEPHPDAIMPAERVEEVQPETAPMQVITPFLRVVRSPVGVPPAAAEAPEAPVVDEVAGQRREGIDLPQEVDLRQDPLGTIPRVEIPERPSELEQQMDIPPVQDEVPVAPEVPRIPEAVRDVEEVQPEVAEIVSPFRRLVLSPIEIPPQEVTPAAARSPADIIRIAEDIQPEPVLEQIPERVDLPHVAELRQEEVIEPIAVAAAGIPERPLELEQLMEIPQVREGALERVEVPSTPDIVRMIEEVRPEATSEQYISPNRRLEGAQREVPLVQEGAQVAAGTARTPEVVSTVEEIQPEIAPLHMTPPFRPLAGSPTEIPPVQELAPVAAATTRSPDGIIMQVQPEGVPMQVPSPIRHLAGSPVAEQLQPAQRPLNLENVPRRRPRKPTKQRRQGMVIIPNTGDPWFISTKRNPPKADWSNYDFVMNKLQEVWIEQVERNAVKSVTATELLRRSNDYNRENTLTLVRLLDKLSLKKSVTFTVQDNDLTIYPFEMPFVTERQMQCISDPDNSELISENVQSSPESSEQSSENLESTPENPEESSGNVESSIENVGQGPESSETSMEI